MTMATRLLGLYYRLAVLLNLFVFVTVNIWIYRARIAYVYLHPEDDPMRPPTISKAISEPSIGEPFAAWVGTSAICLFLAVSAICLLYLRAAREIRAEAPGAALAAYVLVALGLPAQAMASVGMVMLSQYRFPDFHDQHMMGSYIFFAAQCLAILLSAIISVILVRNHRARAALRGKGLILTDVSRFRWMAGLVTVGMVLSYLVLFKIKDTPSSWQDFLFLSYVYLEPTVISVFLLYLQAYNIDLFSAARHLARTRPPHQAS